MNNFVATRKGTFEYAKLDVFMTEEGGGESYIIVKSNVLTKIPRGTQIGENTVWLEDDVIVDSYMMGNEFSYLDHLQSYIPEG
jgi:hypothetical protein